MSKQIHVTPHPNGGWQVKKAGASRASSLHPTQTSAAAKGRSQSRASGGELVIHRPNGQIRAKDSHGKDAYPPKG